METDNTVYIYAYELMFKGVFARNRKEKTAFVPLKKVEMADTQPSEHDLRNMAQKALGELKAKSGRWAVIRRRDESRDGMYYMLPFSTETVLSG